MFRRTERIVAAAAACLGLICVTPAAAQSYSVPVFPFPFFDNAPADDDFDDPQQQRIPPSPPLGVPSDRMVVPDNPAVMPQDNTSEDGSYTLPPNLRRQIVAYPTREAPGTVVIDTPNTYLYYVLGGGRAIRYGIGVGREGFTWSGVRNIGRKIEWPDWHPPAEMIARQPYLPRFMAGGPGNPLGARAMYLQGTLYRIHGTSEPNSIGRHVSSGCIRMLNEDAIDLYNRVNVGTKVVVLPDSQRRARYGDAATKHSRHSRTVSTAQPVVQAENGPQPDAPLPAPLPWFGSSATQIY